MKLNCLSLVAVTSGLALASFGALADATDPSVAGSTAVQGLVAGQAAYLPIMISLAIAAVGIMIAVKWVKRARGAA